MSARLEIAGDEIDWAPAPAALGDVARHDTLPKLLAHNARTWPDRVAQREKEYGIWNAFTWKAMNDHVARIALALKARGVGRGDVVAMLGDNRPEWVWFEIAAHAVGAMSLGVYREALEQEIAYLVDYARPKAILAEDEEQVDKLLSLGDRIPSIGAIIYSDPRGMRKYEDPRLIALDAFEAEGGDALNRDAGAYDALVAETRAEDVAVLCTTSGTTSNPKLSMWTHRAFLGHAAAYLRADPKGPEDEYLAVLPLSWVMEQMYSVAWNLVARMVVNFPEEERTAMADMREIGPSFVLLSPRVWELVAADVRARMMDSRRWKQAIYGWGVKRGVAAVEAGGVDRAAEWALFRALRDRLGFAGLKSAATGGAAMGPDTFRFFQAMGVPLRQLYGQTEALGAHTVHKAGAVRHDTVGFPMPGCALRIRDPDSEGLGEVLVRHPHMMSGYYRNEEATAECFDADGWFLTGDAGYLTEEGHLVVIDRIKDLAETDAGVRFSPQFIENKLKFSTYVAEAVILGKGRAHLAAIICIRYSIVSKWAEQRRIGFTTYSDLAARPEVYELLREEVARVNAELPEAQRIRKFLLLYKELDADDGELTRTKKVRRGVVADKYGDIIDRIYSDADACPIDTVIHFQDGSSQRVVTTLKIERLGLAAADADARDHRGGGVRGLAAMPSAARGGAAVGSAATAVGALTAARFRRDLGGQRFATVLADPPWRFVNRTGKMAPEHRRLSRYETMTTAEICALPVEGTLCDTAHLYLWTPNALLPEALDVMAAWGFSYKTNLIWHKVRKDGGSDGRGVGFYFRNVTEMILFGVRGTNARTLAPGRRQVNFIAARKREHSRKPDEQYDLIEQCSPGPYLELFARGARENWSHWGDQAGVDYAPDWPTYAFNSRTEAVE